MTADLCLLSRRFVLSEKEAEKARASRAGRIRKAKQETRLAGCHSLIYSIRLCSVQRFVCPVLSCLVGWLCVRARERACLRVGACVRVFACACVYVVWAGLARLPIDRPTHPLISPLIYMTTIMTAAYVGAS
jgi:hypothetical protein